MRAFSVLLVASILILAGCVEPDDAPLNTLPEGTLVAVDPETGETTILHAANLSYAQGTLVEKRIDATGSFDLTQHGWPGGMVQAAAGAPPDNRRVYDILADVPKNVPVRIMAEVNAAVDQGDVDLWLDTAPEQVWTARFDSPFGGYTAFEFVVLRTTDDPIEVVLAYDEVDNSQTFDYTLAIDIVAKPDRLMPGVPTAVDVPRGAHRLDITFDETPTGDVWLFGPDDAFLGLLAPHGLVANYTFPADAGPGEYVVMLPQGTADAAVRLVAQSMPERGGAILRPLKQAIVNYGPGSMSANEPGSFTFDVPTIPLQVGGGALVEDFTKDANFRLSSPQGVLLEFAIVDNIPMVNMFAAFGDPMGFFWNVPVGAAGLVPGLYTVEFWGEPNGNGELLGWSVTYIR